MGALGIALDVRKTHVTSLDQARTLGFAASPTVCIAGQDVQAEVHESACGDCTQLGASGASVDCRHWIWRGERHDSAPVGLLVEALLGSALEPGQRGPEPATLSAATVAAMRLGLSLSGAKSRVQRGRALLRRALEGCCRVSLDASGRPSDFAPDRLDGGCSARTPTPIPSA